MRYSDELRVEAKHHLPRHKSIIAYLSANNLPNTAASLRAELSLGEDVFDTATLKNYETLLEKKWTSIVRLEKKAGLQYRLSTLFITPAHHGHSVSNQHSIHRLSTSSPGTTHYNVSLIMQHLPPSPSETKTSLLGSLDPLLGFSGNTPR
jgi:hypothetical protein